MSARPSSLLRALSLCAAFAVPATAQFSQTVRVVADTNPCDPTATHRVDCTDVALKSGAIDLSAFEGAELTITGTYTTTPGGCTTIEVTSAVPPLFRTIITPAPTTQYVPGGNVVITTTAPFGSMVYLSFAAQSDFVDVPGIGLWMLDTATAFVDPTPIQSLGVALRSYSLPDTPDLIGCVLICQAAYVAAGGGAILLNPDCFTVVAG